MKAMTKHEALVKKMNAMTKAHPGKFVVVNGSNMRFCGAAENVNELSSQTEKLVQAGHAPVISKEAPARNGLKPSR